MDAVLTAQNEKRDALARALLASLASTSGAMRWGVDDCGLWCGNIVRLALGYDPCSALRGRYRTRLGARRVLGKGGLPAALRASARRHGWRAIKPGSEQVGDIGIVTVDGVSATVICRAPGWFVGRSDGGWTALQAKHVRLIWAVI